MSSGRVVMEGTRSLAMIVALVLPTSSGCAQVKALRAENAVLKADKAKLEAERDCYDHEREKLAGGVAKEKKRAEEEAGQAADARAEAHGFL